ncbi:MAG: hypothetical protein EXR78_07330 [Deltaproteobacteria bacterium]|nr:hypothetical protein [Deltaproteobacteria bacterium]
MSEIEVPRSTQLLRKAVKTFLDQEQWTEQHLVKWLQGYRLPPVGHSEQPFALILRGLPEGKATGAAQNFARRVAVLLGHLSEIQRLDDRPEECLYNLFMLCAGLQQPEQLAQPLLDILAKKALKGHALGIDLRSALESALIMNQQDDTLRNVWETMAEGNPHEFLPGDEFDALEGARFMPASKDTPGESSLDLIGKALKGVSKRLEQSSDRRRHFRYLVNRLIDTYPRRPTWSMDCLQQAGRHQWAGWAVECLPSLYIPIEVYADGGEQAVLWHYIAACIPTIYKHEVLSPELGNGHVVQVSLSKDAAEFIRRVAPIFEERRITNIYPSDRASVGTTTTAMVELEDEAQQKGNENEANTFAEVRRQLLTGIWTKDIADLPAITRSLRLMAAERATETDGQTPFLYYVKATEKLYGENLRQKIIVSIPDEPWVKAVLSPQH